MTVDKQALEVIADTMHRHAGKGMSFTPELVEFVASEIDKALGREVTE